MTNKGEITKAEYNGKIIKYTVKFENGQKAEGQLGKQLGPGTQMSDKAMEQLKDQLVGKEIKTDFKEIQQGQARRQSPSA